MKCAKCKKLFEYLKTINSRCESCKQEAKLIAKQKQIIKSHEKYLDDADKNTYVECKLCGLRSADIGTHILSHNLTVLEYKEKHGEIRSQSNLKALSGKNNPAHNHGGRLSPFSKKFINYTSNEDISALGRRAANSRNINNNDDKTIHYYTSRGATFEEAQTSLSNRQTTFSLEKCIEKHGEEAGLIKWHDRQNKWQNTLNSKTDEEKCLLNSKRGVLGFHSLWCEDLDLPGYFYVIQIEDKIKIGITTKDNINKRYNGLHKLTDVTVHLFSKTENIKHAFSVEQILCRKYRENININHAQKYKMFGKYEILTGVSIDELLVVSNSYINNSNLCYYEFNQIKSNYE